MARKMWQIALALASVALLSGCLDAQVPENSVNIVRQLSTSQTQTDQKTLECTDGSGGIDIGAQVGQGKVDADVRDAEGAVIFTYSQQASGQSGDDARLTGTPGTWTLTVTATPEAQDYGGYGDYPSQKQFSGQYGATMHCTQDAGE